MDMSTLAAKMLEWEKIKGQLNALTKEIQGAVMEIKTTQNVGNVRATYSQGRKSYEYSTAILKAQISTEQLKPFTKNIPATSVVDFRTACKELKIEDIPFTQPEASVSVKLLPTKTSEPAPEEKAE